MTATDAMPPTPSDTAHLSRNEAQSMTAAHPEPLTDTELQGWLDQLSKVRPGARMGTEIALMRAARELLAARALLATARLTEDDLTAMYRGLVDHACAHGAFDGVDDRLAAYAEGIEHALDTVRMRAQTVAVPREISDRRPTGSGGAAEIRELRRALADIADLSDSECRFDHHGNCQEHGHTDIEPGRQCPTVEARRLLAAVPHA